VEHALCWLNGDAVSQTKYVHYIDRGFYAYDVGLGIFLKYLIDAAEASDQAKAPWLIALVSSWRVTACVGDIGLTLDGDWTPEQIQTFVALSEEACIAIRQRASIPAQEIVDWRVLEGVGIFPRGAKHVPTAPVVELGHAVIALVSGKLPEAPKGKSWLYGAPSGREELTLHHEK
jgi:hypothetical protein